MGGSGYRPSRGTVVTLYAAYSGAAQMGEESREHFSPVWLRTIACQLPSSEHDAEQFSTVRQDTIHHRHARLAGERLTVR